MYRTAKKASYFSNDSEGSINSAKKLEHDYNVCRFVYSHKVFSDFHKVIISATRNSGKILTLIYMQYYFHGNENEINCDETRKKSKTTFSTRKALEEHKSLKEKKRFIKF